MKAKYNYNATIRMGSCDIKVPTTHRGWETAMTVNAVLENDYITLHIVNNLINRRWFANKRLYACIDIQREANMGEE
jgi:hypothetical protein